MINSIIFGVVIFGVNLFFFNFFIVVVAKINIGDLFLRTVLDIVWVTIGVHAARDK